MKATFLSLEKTFLKAKGQPWRRFFPSQEIEKSIHQKFTAPIRKQNILRIQNQKKYKIPLPALLTFNLMVHLG